ncbi:hypothetical protein DL98DRAFT_599670 [Cadophora sp. DSE1049]|nr:hypothetical protein DL98DRAFT_599670 [Cadophora sp. DSE1049]
MSVFVLVTWILVLAIAKGPTAAMKNFSGIADSETWHVVDAEAGLQPGNRPLLGMSALRTSGMPSNRATAGLKTFGWTLERINRPALVLQVLLLETVATYVILFLAYLYLAATRYKKEGGILWNDVLSCTLVSVVHGIGAYLVGNNRQELTLSVWVVSALANLLVTLQFRFCLLCRGSRAEVDLEKQPLNDPGVQAVKSLVMTTQKFFSSVPSPASSPSPMVLSDLLHTSMPTLELSQLQKSLQAPSPEKREEQYVGACYRQVLSQKVNVDSSLSKSNVSPLDSAHP